MHYIWKEQAGHLLHPRITADIQPEGVKIAELGTGTGYVAITQAETEVSSMTVYVSTLLTDMTLGYGCLTLRESCLAQLSSMALIST